MLRKRIVMMIMVCVVFSAIHAQVNPFLSGDTSDENPGISQEVVRRVEEIKPLNQSTMLIRSARVQRVLQQKITALLDGTNTMAGLLIMLVISFLYGMLHALGPGHRKAIIIGYFLGEKSSMCKGLGIGLLLALEHGGGAVLLVTGLAWVTRASLSLRANSAQSILLPVSYIVVIMLGFWMIVDGLRTKRKKESNLETDSSQKSVIGLLLSGLVPCPAATAVMIFSLTHGSLAAGMLSVAAMSLGIGVVLSVIGIATVLLRKRMEHFCTPSHRGTYLDVGLHLVSGILLVALGVMYLQQGFI